MRECVCERERESVRAGERNAFVYEAARGERTVNNGTRASMNGTGKQRERESMKSSKRERETEKGLRTGCLYYDEMKQERKGEESGLEKDEKKRTLRSRCPERGWG